MKRENFDARGSVAKILCKVVEGGEFFLLFLPTERQRNPFHLQLFEAFMGKKKIR